MKIKIARDQEEPTEVQYLKIVQGDTEFRITENKFGELVINKYSHEDSSSINIQPIMSNEIILK